MPTQREPTLEAFYERLTPFAEIFMALFGRDRLPHRSTLSRFLAALDQTPVEALRTLYARGSARPQTVRVPRRLVRAVRKSSGWWWMWTGPDKPPGSAALPQTESLPTPHRRARPGLRAGLAFDASEEKWCAPAQSCSRRIRTRISGTFGGPGNGDYRGELLRVIQVTTSYATKLGLSTASVLLRLDGHDARRGSTHRCPDCWPWGDYQKS
jgi:hypothetical protein